MAINPYSLFPTKTSAPSGDYPYGSARNVTVSGDGTGTPWDFRVLNDVWGFLQYLLNAAGITPSGVADNVNTSDYATALFQSAIIPSNGIEGLELDKLRYSGGVGTYINYNAYRLQITPDEIRMYSRGSAGGDNSYLELGNGNAATPALKYYSGVNGQIVYMDSSGNVVEAPAGTTYQLQTLISGRGISYTAVPGQSQPGSPELSLRRTRFDVSGLTWTVDAGTSSIYYISSGTVVLTGLASTSEIVDAQLTWDDSVTGRRYSAPAYVELTYVGGVPQTSNFEVLSNTSPSAANMQNQQLRILYEAAGVN